MAWTNEEGTGQTPPLQIFFDGGVWVYQDGVAALLRTPFHDDYVEVE